MGGYKQFGTASLPEPLQKGQKLNWNYKVGDI